MTIHSPLISVVIPAYNRRDTLGRALQSVWVQEVEDIEVVIVDDGSTDGTREYLSELAEQNRKIRPIFHEQNKGEAGARNTGVRSAAGEYVAFLDSDDEWMPGKLRAQIDLMRSTDDGVGACCTGQYIQYEDGRRDRICDWSDQHEITDRNILIRGCGVSMGLTFLIRRAVYQHVGYYDENLPLLVDVDWLCRLLLRYRVIKIRDAYAIYNKAPMRTAAPMERAVAEFKVKNADYLATFGLLDRMAIDSRFFCYISASYQVHGPWVGYVLSQMKFLLNNPFQSPKQYAYFLAVVLGLKKVGSGS